MRGDASGQDNIASRLSDADIDVLCYYDTCANDVIRTMDLDDFFCGDIVFLSGLTTRPDDLPSVVMREIIITKTGAVFTAEDTAAVDLDTCGATYADALLFTDLQLPRDMLGGVALVPLDLSEGGVTYDGFLNANWVHIPDVMREYRIRKAGNDKAKKGGMIK